MRCARVPLAGLLLCVALPACVSDIDFYSQGGGDGGVVVPGSDGGTPFLRDGGHAPDGPVVLGGGGISDCAASIASTVMRQALCTCATLSMQGALSTKMVDNGQPLGFSAKPWAAVASNDIAAFGSGDYYVYGAFITVGQVTAAPFADGYVQGALRVGGAVTVNDPLDVGDAWIGGNINGPLHVRGRLHVPFGTQVPGQIDEDPVFEPIDVAPPCDCRPDRVAVAQLVSEHAQNNDNQRAGLGDKWLENKRVSLPAGEYYWPSNFVTGAITLDVHGPVALYVAGSIVHLGGSLVVNLDPDASLDVLFTGDFSSSASFRDLIGDFKHPSRVRLWSSGERISFVSRPNVGALLYAPRAQLNAPAGLELWGAALVKDVTVSGAGFLDIHFDRAILRAGAESCGAPVATPLE